MLLNHGIREWLWADWRGAPRLPLERCTVGAQPEHRARPEKLLEGTRIEVHDSRHGIGGREEWLVGLSTRGSESTATAYPPSGQNSKIRVQDCSAPPSQ
jgi:hypothetical protein